jgi:transcriptional regulator with XRE-family HTH domain
MITTSGRAGDRRTLDRPRPGSPAADPADSAPTVTRLDSGASVASFSALPTSPDQDHEWRSWMRAVGREARLVREFLGLSQDKVSQLAGVSQGAVSRLESGRALATPMVVVLKVALALVAVLRTLDPDELNADVARLLSILNEVTAAWPASDAGGTSIGRDPDLDELVRLYRATPIAQREVVLALLRSFAR